MRASRRLDEYGLFFCSILAIGTVWDQGLGKSDQLVHSFLYALSSVSEVLVSRLLRLHAAAVDYDSQPAAQARTFGEVRARR